MTTQSEKQNEPGGGGRRVLTQVSSLDDLVGAHPEALRAIYGAGKVADPAELGAAPRGRLLAVDPLASVFMLTRPVLQALAQGGLPWKGKTFDHGGNSGTNVVFGKQAFRFRTEVGPSAIDGAPTFALLYGERAFKNPWPLRALRDELRTVGDGIAIGPALLSWRGRDVPILWFGLERAGT